MTLAVLLSIGAASAEDRNNVWSSCYVVTSTEVLAAWKTEAETGNLSAQFCLGVMFELGMDVAQDFSETARLYRMAADQGDQVALIALGNLYYDGRGVPQDYAEAARLYDLAVTKGSKFGSFSALGTLTEEQQKLVGFDKVFQMYSLAMTHEASAAILKLGFLYETGRALPKSFISAHMHFNIACALGNDTGCFMRDELAQADTENDTVEAAVASAVACAIDEAACVLRSQETGKKMTPADISEAQRRARVCMESDYKDCD
jgi:TPR repeat protein